MVNYRVADLRLIATALRAGRVTSRARSKNPVRQVRPGSWTRGQQIELWEPPPGN